MNHISKLTRSRWLLLTLFTLLVGVSPAWADTLTETFDAVTVTSRYLLSNGWVMVHSGGNYQGFGGSYDYQIKSGNYDGETGNSLYCSYSDANEYVVIPTKLSGTFTYYAKRAESSNGTITFFEATEEDGVFTIGSQLATTSTSSSWGNQKSFSLGDAGKYVAFQLIKSRIDQISATIYEAASGPGFAVKDGSTTLDSPYAYSFGLTTAGTTKTFKLTNPGTAATPISIDVTGANGFTAAVEDNATSIPAGGEKTLTITMPNATASGSVVVTPTGDGLSAFTFNVSGTVRDPNKVYLDFSDSQIPDGWTSVRTGSYGSAWAASTGFVSQSGGYSSYAWAFTSPKLNFTNGEEVFFETAKYSDSNYYSPSITVEYTTDETGATGWTAIGSAFTDDTYGNWTKRCVTIPVEGVKRIRFNGWYIHMRNIYGGEEPNEPKMVVTQPTTLGFGLYDKDADPAPTKTFTIANTGKATLSGISVSSANAAFTITGAPTSLAAGASETVTITMSTATTGALSSLITVSATGMEDASFTVTGTVLPAGTETVDFNTAIPGGWENQDNGWTIYNNEAAKCTGKKNLTTQKLDFSGEASPFFLMKVKASDSGSGDYITVEGSTDNGTTWTAFDKKTYSYPTDFGNNTGDYSDIVVSIPNTVNKLRFNGYYVLVDEIAGLKYSAYDPTIAVFSDAEATASVASGTTKDFGWANTAQSATYYIKNSGTGTLTISEISAVDGFTAATAGDVMTVAAGADPLALTVTMTNAAVGAKSGTFTITTDGGNFEIPVKGFIYSSKNLVDFTDASQYQGWTTEGWTISEGAASVSSSKTMQTTKFSVEANEKLYVEAKSNGSYYSSANLTYSYSTDNGENWTDGVTPIIASTTNSSDYEVYTLSDIADAEVVRTVLLRFTGANVAINRIYGFTAVATPVMETTASDIAFGSQTAESTEQTFTISNTGTANLTGLSVTLGKTGEDAEYAVRMEKDDAEFTGTTIAPSEVVTVYVKQLFDINKVGSKSDVLTIAATNQAPVAINLTGTTKDPFALDIDFNSSSEWPAAILEHGDNWTVYNYSGSGEARQGNYSTATSLTLTPLTVTSETDEFKFDVAYYNYSSYRELIVSYTTDGGNTWTDYNWGTEQDPVYDLKQNIGSSYDTKTITGIPAGTVVFKFTGKCIKLDNITADYRLTTAPLVAFAKVTDNISDANLTADAEATYTLANIGNANYVGTVAKSNVNVAISGDGVTYEASTLTIPAGKTAEITVTMPFAAPYGAKNGSMTITSESWVGEVAVNYTASLINPDAINVDFASDPAGWYNAGWTVNGTANIYSGVEKELITEQYAAEAGKNVLSFKAKAQSGNEGTLKVYASTDRKTWSEPTEFGLTNEYVSKSLDALADGNYYVKFVSSNANIDDLTGLKKITTAPEHDLYVSASNIPAATKVPETSITATATVYSLRTAETGVYAKLFFDNVEVATADAQDISLNDSKTFELTGNVPAVEKTYAAKIVVYYNDNSVAFETLTTNVEVQHTRTLAITAFERVGEGDLSADVDNKITAQFNVTVQNNSTCDLTADEVKVSIVNAAGEGYQMNDADNVTAATAVLAKDASVVIPVTLTISAGEGGDFKFRAKELVSNTATLEANDITIHVNAQAPQFALNIKGGAALADGDDVAFGLVKEATTKQYTISNTGTKALVLTSIVAPAGYSVTEINDVNKTIAVNGTLDIDVMLLAEQGKKAGALVFTYDVNGTPTTFTLALTGRSEAANVWEEYFTSEIPASWQKTGWTWNADRQTAYSGGVQGEFTLMTPRLSAAAGQVLTYETKWQYDGENMTVQYSTDKTSWTDYETITASTETVEHQFVAPAAGNYYLKFTANRYVNLDNFIGFALNIPEHDMELAASSVPTTGKRLNNYVATVTLKENAGKNENITAELWVDGAKVNATADVTSVEANSNAAVVTLTWEPQTTMNAVDAYVKVTYAGGTLETTPVSLTIAEVYTLSENSDAVEAVNNETVMLQRTFAAGWNTICLPFAVADNTAIKALFGAGAKVFNFKNFANNMIEFEAVTSMAAATPYLIYVPAVITEPIRVNNVTISGLNTTAGTASHNSIIFQGSYAPVAAGGLNGKYGVTTANKLAKGNANTTMKGFRAYFEGSLAGARIYTFDDATGISHVYQAAEVFGDDDRVYNMNGQHVENAKKGVYIVNGRKVVIK